MFTVVNHLLPFSHTHLIINQFCRPYYIVNEANFTAESELRMKDSANNVRRMIQIDILMKFDAHTRTGVDWQCMWKFLYPH
jgi:hypothetical protein